MTNDNIKAFLLNISLYESYHSRKEKWIVAFSTIVLRSNCDFTTHAMYVHLSVDPVNLITFVSGGSDEIERRATRYDLHFKGPHHLRFDRGEVLQ